ncbi:DUF1847 domain-containing protein [uncultured Desulfobacter sp.]|uniref:DUF1847 domain-containing protein n=1 Tax=uncultured Desulfobacter sp. TaxID=240139 RepID=UPI0029F5865C|nr:DUF1847 domain-containing protein [uncultured Desulfobacter sp.]
MENTPNCAQCSIKMSERLCKSPDGKSPDGCPTQNKTELIKQAAEEYKKPDVYYFAKQASIQESDGYGNKELGYAHLKPVKPRILEVMEFAQKMGYKKLGLVFCIGLRKEAKTVAKLYSSKGFTVTSVVCKVGCAFKETIGIENDQKLDPGTDEAMCNPILQAMVLNDEQTEFNILLGLCVGHDSLFFKYAQAPCTVLAVKDRLLGHNPLAAVYNIDSYYRSLK